MEKTTLPLPNFLIVGAAKSGTTSLYEYLRGHPDVFMPDWKEPAFFAPPEAGGVTAEAEYRKLFAGAEGKKAIGEASVAYLYVPDAPEKIKSLLGSETKIVVILRNPVDMAYSNWGHQAREGYEALPFADAITKEKERLADPDFFRKNGSWAANLAYLDRARYSKQLDNYMHTFPAANIKVYIYEEFFKPDLPQWRDLCLFLGINAGIRPKRKTYNPAGTARNRQLQKFLNRPSGIKDALKTLLPAPVRSVIRKKLETLNRKDANLQPLENNLRRQLENDFRADVRRLEKILDRSLQDIWF